ncbi:hypothetical protein [Streptacidiphilus carbonis]|jgi:hypothetical protein|uniref:hypothetical protein n=1 Tax=Streptacidiphilus carbonis TaxID=105422 RepID=UPI0005AA8F3C|nr:hypothetical protein [Streptacidiphilus carbonis]
MTALDWITVTDVRLREALIPDPDGTGTLDSIAQGRVATDGAFLHIAPGDGDADAETLVTTVPAAAVLSFSYVRTPRPSAAGRFL